MKKSIKKLSSIISMAAIMSTTFGTNIVSAKTTTLSPYNENSLIESAQAAAESDGMYATNPSKCVGKSATIKSMTDFTSDMLVAQSGAWDVPNTWNGAHENSVADCYGLYAAWDDTNLYVGLEMVNTTDTWANGGDGPLSDGGKMSDVPVVLAIDVGNKTPIKGKMEAKSNDKYIWGLKLAFETRVDHLFIGSVKGTGTPGLFLAKEDGTASYDKEYCLSYKDNGITYTATDGSISPKIMHLVGSSDVADSHDISKYKDAVAAGHNRKYDTFFTYTIPLKVLGIDKSYIESKGIGIMGLGTRGESSLDCIPHDPSMLDAVMDPYRAGDNTSFEKEDLDTITVPLASVGKLRDSSVVPPVNTDPTISKLEADKEDITVGDEVKFTCTATNTKSYSFTIDGEEVEDSEVSKNVLTHKFDKEGTYKVKVTAKGDAGTKDATKEIEVTVNKSGDNPPIDELTISKFTATPDSKCEEGSDVKLTATASEADCEYKFVVVDEDDNELTIQDYSSEAEATWTPKKAGTYTLKVYAKTEEIDEEKAVTKEIKDFKVTEKTIDSELTMDSFDADVKEGTIELGKEVNFTAKASGSDDITYSYTVSKDGGDEEELESKDGKATWSADEEGTYKIKVTASADGFDDITESKTYKVEKKDMPSEEDFIASISTTSSGKEKLGSKVKFTASSENAQGDVTYKFVVNKLDSKYSSKEFTSKAIYYFEPEEAGTYEVYVIAKDNETGEEYNTEKFTIEFEDDNIDANKELKATISVSTKVPQVGDTVTITPTTENEDGEVTYQLLVDGEEVGEAVTGDKLTWTPKEAGTYKVSVIATDDSGKPAKSNEISVKVSEKAVKPEDDNKNPGDTQTADNTPIKALGILGVLGSAVAVLSRRKAK